MHESTEHQNHILNKEDDMDMKNSEIKVFLKSMLVTLGAVKDGTRKESKVFTSELEKMENSLEKNAVLIDELQNLVKTLTEKVEAGAHMTKTGRKTEALNIYLNEIEKKNVGIIDLVVSMGNRVRSLTAAAIREKTKKQEIEELKAAIKHLEDMHQDVAKRLKKVSFILFLNVTVISFALRCPERVIVAYLNTIITIFV